MYVRPLRSLPRRFFGLPFDLVNFTAERARLSQLESGQNARTVPPQRLAAKLIHVNLSCEFERIQGRKRAMT